MLKRLLACLAITGLLVGHSLAQGVTFNTATTCPGITLSNGNLTASFIAPQPANDWIAPVNAFISLSSKVYFEFIQSSFTTGGGGSNLQIGAMNFFYGINCGTNSFPGDGQGSNPTGFIEDNKGQVVTAGVFVATLAPYTTVGSNIGIAIDTINKKFWARINGGNWNNDILANQNPATNIGGIDISPNLTTAGLGLIPFVLFRDAGGGTLTGQFASASWSNPAPSGFTELSLPPVKGISSLNVLGGKNNSINANAATAVSCAAPCGTVTFNVVTDFGAVCNGIANDDPFFNVAHNAMVSDARVIAGANVTLVVPPGSHCTFSTCSVGNFATGLNDFTLIMTGATFNGTGGGCEQWGNNHIVAGTNPHINTVSAGASCVTTITPADAASFTPGRWTMLNGLGMQAGGFPPNLAVWEYIQVASSNPGTGQVCFITPLVNAYKSTWTDLGDGITGANCGGVGLSCGGAGRLQLMRTDWPHTINFIGGTWEFWAAPLFYSSRIANFTDVTWITSNPNNPNCFTPTFSGTITFERVTIINCSIEADKEVETWIVNNSSIITFFQSASFHNLIMNNSTVPFLFGTAQHTVCNNSTIGGIQFGNNFGASKSFSGTNCHLTGSIAMGGGTSGGFGTAYGGSNINGPYSYAGSGVIQVIGGNNGGPGFNPFAPPLFWEPGTVAILSNQSVFNAGFPFTISDNSCVDTQGSPPCVGGQLSINTTIPGANLPPGEAVRTLTSGTYVSATGLITLTMPSSTDFALDQFVTLDTLTGTGAFASLNGTWATTSPTSGTTVTLKGPVGAGAATISGGNATARVTSLHPDQMRDWACTNCDGTPQTVELSLAPAQHQPLFTYSSRTYTCTANLPNVPNSDDLNHPTGYGLLGNFVSATINVSVADTGPNGSLSMGTDQFGQISNINQVTGVRTAFGYGTNLKIAGTRTITPTTVTGAQAGDSGTFPGANSWFGANTGIFTSQDLTTELAAQCPVVTLTFVLTR